MPYGELVWNRICVILRFRLSLRLFVIQCRISYCSTCQFWYSCIVVCCAEETRRVRVVGAFPRGFDTVGADRSLLSAFQSTSATSFTAARRTDATTSTRPRFSFLWGCHQLADLPISCKCRLGVSLSQASLTDAVELASRGTEESKRDTRLCRLSGSIVSRHFPAEISWWLGRVFGGPTDPWKPVGLASTGSAPYAFSCMPKVGMAKITVPMPVSTEHNVVLIFIHRSLF